MFEYVYEMVDEHPWLIIPLSIIAIVVGGVIGGFIGVLLF